MNKIKIFLITSGSNLLFMPLALKFIVLTCILWSVSIGSQYLFIGGYSASGVELSVLELLLSALFMIFLLVGGIGIIYRQQWARWIVFILFVFPFVWDFLQHTFASGPKFRYYLSDFAEWIIGALILLWYLFIKKSVRRCFGLVERTTDKKMTFVSWGIFVPLWIATLFIHLYDVETREGIVSIYVYNFYAWIFALTKEPIRVMTDSPAWSALLLFVIAGLLHSSICWILSKLIAIGLLNIRSSKTLL